MKVSHPSINIAGRHVGVGSPPLVIAEIGINHGGSLEKAVHMIDDIADVGGECVKFQCHIIRDEMIPNTVIPGNSDKTIWEIIQEATLTKSEEKRLKDYVEQKNLIYLSTPFSRKAADRLQGMKVPAFKIGSGECNNYPLIHYVCSLGQPLIVSTGMNNIEAIKKTSSIIRNSGRSFALLHCTSVYPTSYKDVRLSALAVLKKEVPDAVIGISDHSLGIYTALGAAALGASIIEKHFTSDKTWSGPDVPISIGKSELKMLIEGANAIYAAGGGNVGILPEEFPTIAFAYSSVVSIRSICKGETLTQDNIWVKRPGTGTFRAEDYDSLLGKQASKDIPVDSQIDSSMLV